jgi:hypothetical protein
MSSFQAMNFDSSGIAEPRRKKHLERRCGREQSQLIDIPLARIQICGRSFVALLEDVENKDTVFTPGPTEIA